ncbi:MAG: BamA/TamA family outer membrane protein [Bacteroidales bacterium]|nr:BamA/TamA family outer membrane protein [Bacteroidales bacterium]
MKRLFTLMILLAAALTTVNAQEEIKKTGINFGPLPAIGYSSDLGWHYGALTDIYQYGDGSVYPDYKWKINVEASWYSKGNSVYHAFFDSKYLIPGLRVSADVSYFGNKTDNFYGFNGASSLYIPGLDKITEGQGLYLMHRDIFRTLLMFQGKFGEDSHWGWAAGVTYWNVRTGHAVNKSLVAANDFSLYDLYVQDGIIPAAEKDGGQHLEFKAGIVFDTRDHENNPTRGTNIEAYIYGSPDIISKHDNNYLKLAVHVKQFFPIGERIVIGAHLGFQGLLAGNTPYYMLSTIQTINLKQIRPEGLGSTCTVRGTVYNRLQGNSYAWLNAEFRWTFVKFRWINQNWALATNPFFDMGMVVSPYRLEQMKTLQQDNTLVATFDNKNYTAADFYTKQAEKLHMSAGIGLHVIMNQNFNINFEFGKCFDPNDGKGLGINIGLNYIF